MPPEPYNQLENEDDEPATPDNKKMTDDDLREIAKLVYNLMLQDIRVERERR